MSGVWRVARVTGAASGMGLVTSRRFLDSGDRVVAWDIDADGLTRAWAGAGPGRALTATVDVAEPDDIAGITYFLASPAARMIVGQTVVADVGVTRRP